MKKNIFFKKNTLDLTKQLNTLMHKFVLKDIADDAFPPAVMESLQNRPKFTLKKYSKFANQI